MRKIIRECHRVLDYLAVAEVIETLDELVQFLRDLSPCLSKVSREVSAREKELTHQVLRLMQLKSEITAFKTFVGPFGNFSEMFGASENSGPHSDLFDEDLYPYRVSRR